MSCLSKHIYFAIRTRAPKGNVDVYLYYAPVARTFDMFVWLRPKNGKCTKTPRLYSRERGGWGFPYDIPDLEKAVGESILHAIEHVIRVSNSLKFTV